MKYIAFISLFLIGTTIYGQQYFRTENRRDLPTQSVPTLLHDLKNKNDDVVSFRVRYTDIDEESNYFILTRKGDYLNAFKFLDQSKQVQTLLLDPELLALIWDTFMQNELFSIEDEKNISVFCPEKYRIYNAYTYEFVLFNKGIMKKLSYDDPEYYDNACYGMTERRKIINSVAVINYVLNR